MKYLLPLLVFLISSNGFAQSKYSPKLAWAMGLGSSGNDRNVGLSLGPNGDIYTSGYFSNTLDFDPNGQGFSLNAGSGEAGYVARYNQLNNLIWAVHFTSSTGDVVVRNIDVDPQGNVYATGRFQGSVDFDPSSSNYTLSSNGSYDAFLIKLNSQGGLAWAVSFGGSLDDNGIGIKHNPLGAVMVSGYFKGAVDFDPGMATQTVTGRNSENIFMSCFDTTGSFLWTNAMPSSSNLGGTARAVNVALDGSNNFLVAGSYFGTIDLDPSSATANISSQGNEDAFFAAYTINGNYLWSQHFGGSGFEMATGVEMGTDQAFVVSGFYTSNTDFDPGTATLTKSSNGSRDVFVSKFDPTLNLMWNVVGGGPSSEASTFLALDNNNNIFLTGYCYSAFDANPDPNDTHFISSLSSTGDGFFWGLDTAGNLLTAFAISSPGIETAQVINIDHKDNIYLGGTFSSSVDFDPGQGSFTLSANGGTDGFIKKFSICKETRDSITASGCQFYISPNGSFYNISGNYVDTLTNQAGCDSLLHINLTLGNLSTAVTTADPILYADSNQSVSYQWLDCSNGYAPISGATSARYTATQNGSYAVELSQGSCKDTSACFQVFTIGMADQNRDLENAMSIYPNPTKESVNLINNTNSPIVSYSILNMQGQKIRQSTLENVKVNLVELPVEKGLYFMQLLLENGETVSKKVIKL